MKKYAKIINEETKQCEVGLGTNSAFYQSIGMTEMEVEQAYNGNYYIKGYAPEKPQEVKEKEARKTRDIFLEKYVDFYQSKPLLWEELDDEKKKNITQYRKYLKDYPESSENWFEKEPLTFEDWLNNNTQEEHLMKVQML